MTITVILVDFRSVIATEPVRAEGSEGPAFECASKSSLPLQLFPEPG